MTGITKYIYRGIHKKEYDSTINLHYKAFTKFAFLNLLVSYSEYFFRHNATSC